MEKFSLLIVDDEVDICDLLEMELSDSGYDIFTAHSFDQALEIFKENKERIKGIISDVQMPGKNGVELMTEIKKQYSEEAPFFILISGQTSFSIKEVLDAGSVALMAKPLNLESLKEIVNLEISLREFEGNIRDSIRVKANCDVLIEYKSGKKLEAKSGELGKNGLFLIMKDAIPKINDELEVTITFRLSSIRIVKAKAICRWARYESVSGQDDLTAGFGIQFSNIDEAEYEKYIECYNEMLTNVGEN